MEYKHDFFKKTGKKKHFFVITGLFFAISSIYLVGETSNLGLTIIYFVWGMSFFFEGIGIPPASLIGRKFILVNDEKIHFKFSLWKKGTLLHLRDIENLEIWPGYIRIEKQNNETKKIDLRDLNPQTRHDTLMAIASAAEKMQIKHTKHGYLEYYN